VPPNELVSLTMIVSLCWSLLGEFSSSTSYVKTSLKPFTVYQFRVVAMTSYGESTSPWSTVQTPQDREYIIAIPVPKLTSLSVTSLHLSQSFVMYIITNDYYDHVKSYKK